MGEGEAGWGAAGGGWGEWGGGAGGACCRCALRRRASARGCLGVCALVLGYGALGALLFLALEGGAGDGVGDGGGDGVGDGGGDGADGAVAASRRPAPAAGLRDSTVERLWAITEDLNILYKENWTKLAAKELMDFQKVLVQSLRRESRLHAEPPPYRWTFSTSFLYALTLITTIGHGNVTPKSSAGKLVAIAYACVGIPLVMVYLSTVGEALARRARALYWRLAPAARGEWGERGARGCGPPAKGDAAPERSWTPFQAALNLDSPRGGYHWTCRDHTRVPILLSLLLIVSYIALGTVVFHATEKWTLIDGCYFSFASLATIGFGSLRPGLHASGVSARAEDAAVGACCVYILVGIVLVAMCFNLAQAGAGGVAARCGPRARAVHHAQTAQTARTARAARS